jgi:hypothetical protein
VKRFLCCDVVVSNRLDDPLYDCFSASFAAISLLICIEPHQLRRQTQRLQPFALPADAIVMQRVICLRPRLFATNPSADLSVAQ